MARRARVDAELVRRGMARSREHAVELIDAGRVKIAGTVATKPATAVEAGTPLVVSAEDNEVNWASRGAHKLFGALEVFEQNGFSVAGKRCLDAGASTGGFTDVLLSKDAAEVVAVDVGYGQLVWRLQSDDRVTVVDRTNVRSIDADTIGGRVEVVVADLSFISLKLVLPAFVACVVPGADLALMVKPQFEVGKDRVGSGGVVRDQALRAESVIDVANTARDLGLALRDVTASPLPGPSGNVEYFLWLRSQTVEQADDTERDIVALVERAVEEGPQ
ncbi:TlyA family RNA methyltransferase [Rhodococcus sp. BP-252]|uniref:TlyA family RNA methyltransferase n=1 Tax=unclassified Rhodococcus (in: high G+C Gram-positive bacteria) TaxID=192944 RepID=UPI001C9A6BBE|nr:MULTISPECIES: TlyA family RNA methyltransferase [unclassified Rhodococcus (in: high G+C Gram-positive bacteria)]MBY6410278.1 TlyA family RNA methyltransferase [Rhodococcus sp. BP-320]MBY6415247.1 TlyA family RNA methyltransferase [Rhodococcus sp. BP-321]MBY6424255.1 TlyA family RNA methyltransferase [Rhodococcus sp. BP-324]MBY6429395.1 TlyA family RNA methyltransferase [Rhodococcus sp. BP-323]MBY6430143.1 TlyA family RNA methyltransferase [Rhodococcus sp. BP-322]